MPGVEPGDEGVREIEQLPKSYGVTILYRVLRVAERFGRGEFTSPIDWWDAMKESEQAVLLAYETIRQQEEARESAWRGASR